MTRISGVTQSDTARGPIFRVQTANGEYSTFNGAAAHQARQLIGAEVVLTYTQKEVDKNGQHFTNLYYEGAEATTGTLPGFAGPPPGFGNSPSGLAPLNFTPPAAPPESDREIKIMRQTATKVAAHMLGYLDAAEQTPTGLLDISEFLVSYYQHGHTPTRPMPAYGDPGPEQAPMYSDDDIPF
jgi:hypothetical protein